VDVFGSFALILAFVCAVYAFVGGIAAILTRHPLLVKSTRQAGIATCASSSIFTKRSRALRVPRNGRRR